MTRMEILQIFYTRKHEIAIRGDFDGPTKWFISRKEWYLLPAVLGPGEIFAYVQITGGKNELCGLPVYQVIEDGIFECH